MLAALTAGCFQPVYGQRPAPTGEPGLRTALASVEIKEIVAPPASAQARLAVELQNELNYALTGGGGALPPTHTLTITLIPRTQQLIVDPTTARGEFEIVSIDASYTLTDLRSKKTVITGSATSRSSYDIPGQQQRYAMLRGQRDSQSNATKVVAEQIRNRLASYFAAGS